MLTALLESIAPVVPDTRTGGVIDFELVVARITDIEHLFDCAAQDDQRHQQVREEFLVTVAVKCVPRMCAFT